MDDKLHRWYRYFPSGFAVVYLLRDALAKRASPLQEITNSRGSKSSVTDPGTSVMSTVSGAPAFAPVASEAEIAMLNLASSLIAAQTLKPSQTFTPS